MTTMAGDDSDLRSGMKLALAEAALATTHGDVPVGAVVTIGGAVISSRHNEREVRGDPLAHAELLAIRDAALAVRGGDLGVATLFVTLEPCVMCAGALLAACVGTVVFGAADSVAGGCGSRYDVLGDIRLGPPPTVHRGVLADESASMLRTFFAARRP